MAAAAAADVTLCADRGALSVTERATAHGSENSNRQGGNDCSTD